MKCKATRSDNMKCQANAMHDSHYCFRHSKDMEAKATQASSNGGKAKRQYLCLGNPMKIKTPEDIKKLMARSINKLWSGEMPAGNPAGALGYLAKIFLEAYEKSELEIRMEAIENRLDQINT